MGRPKGGINRYWSKEEKLKAVKRVLNNHETADNVRKELEISPSLLHAWIKKYLNEGEDGLINKINWRFKRMYKKW